MIFDRLLCQMESPDPNILLGYGTILVAQQKFGVGISMLRTGLAVYDKHPLAWCNLGVAYKFIGRDDLALAAYDRAIALDPNMPEVLAGIAGYWINKDSPQKVIDYSDRALKVNPMLPAARMHLGMGLLEQGRFQEAWMHYEFRWDTAERVNDQRPYKAPRWEGERVKTLAIHGEQGLGDEIMFMSLLREAQKRADRVIVECAERLVRTFSEGFGVPCYPNHAALIEAEGEPDAYIPMGSLPSGPGHARRQAVFAKTRSPGPAQQAADRYCLEGRDGPDQLQRPHPEIIRPPAPLAHEGFRFRVRAVWRR
jgi:tetratricopeptide (TPR) repeat protein